MVPLASSPCMARIRLPLLSSYNSIYLKTSTRLFSVDHCMVGHRYPTIVHVSSYPDIRSVRFISNASSPNIQHMKFQSNIQLFAKFSTIYPIFVRPMTTNVDDGTSNGIFNRFKFVMNKFGKVAFVIHTTIAAVNFSVIFVLLRSGVDVPLLLEKLIPESWLNSIFDGKIPGHIETAGVAAAALAIHKSTILIRLPITITITPTIAEWWNKYCQKKSSKL